MPVLTQGEEQAEVMVKVGVMVFLIGGNRARSPCEEGRGTTWRRSQTFAAAGC
jgi:hypothetical protein